MKTFNTLEEIKDIKPCCVALGNFDGVHAGHQALIKAAVEKANVRAWELSDREREIIAKLSGRN